MGLPEEVLNEKARETKEVKKTDKEMLKERGDAVGAFLEKNHPDVYAGNDTEVKNLRESGELREPSEENAKEIVETLFRVYKIKISELPEEVQKKLDTRKELESFDGVRENILEDILNKNISGVELAELLEKKFGITDLKEKAKKILNDCENAIKGLLEVERFLVHGDMKLESIHADKEGKVTTSRLVHATSSENVVLPLIYDLGNLLGRAAGKPEFQDALREAVLEKFKNIGNPGLGGKILETAELRTSLKFIGYIESGAAEFTPEQRESHKKTLLKTLEAGEAK